MENREILIANTKTQTRNKITSSATTLGELKADMDAAGIDYSGMTFTEGISKTQLLDDATQLPQNVMFKGNPTNNLVILLTNTKKNIASGALSRQDAYAIIRNRNLQDAIKEHFGRNFTQVPTADLISFIEGNANTAPASTKDAASIASAQPAKNCSKPASSNHSHMFSVAEAVTDSFCTVVDRLYKDAVISLNELPFISQRVEDTVNGLLNGTLDRKPPFFIPETTVSKKSNDSIEGISEDDVDDMINDIL